MKKVSVIVPVYNVEDYVDGCLKSLINQTYNNIEIIVVNDGSTDNCPKICDNYKKQDNRIIVVHKTNGGLSSARNAGINNASGEYVMFVDGDDYLAENAIELLISEITKWNVDIIQFDYEETYFNYHRVINGEEIKEVYVNNTKQMFEQLYKIGGAAASACSKLYKRDLFKNLRFKEGILHEDEQLITFMLQTAKSMLYIPNKLYYYVMRQGSIIKSTFSTRKLDIFEILEERRNEFKRLGYDDLYKIEQNRYFKTLVMYWNEAKICGANDSCRELQNLMQVFVKSNKKLKLHGIMKFIYLACRINPSGISMYYYLKAARNIIRKVGYSKNGADVEKNN